ncbi:beta-lactamase class A [Sphingobium faniae]|nr:beta-lactamase class A [Sphingobium faniae]
MPLYRIFGAAAAALGLFLAPLPTADAFGPVKNVRQQSAEARLLAQFESFAALTDGTVGIAVQDLSTGEEQSLNGDMLFPMASTYKVAVAGKILSMADAGVLGLQDQVPLDPAQPARTRSIHDLIDLMLTHSDNDATDALVARAGGPAVIDDWVGALGVKGLRVDSNTAHLLYRAMGISPAAGSFRRNVAAALEADPSLRQRDARDLPNVAFTRDPRDTSTPRAMNALLAAIRLGQALKPASTAYLLEMMERCHTGKARLKAMLPPGARIAHKTGSLNGYGGDVGIVTLPDGRMFAISVFVMKDYKGRTTRDSIMAHAARAAYDYFLFAPARRTA